MVLDALTLSAILEKTLSLAEQGRQTWGYMQGTRSFL